MLTLHRYFIYVLHIVLAGLLFVAVAPHGYAVAETTLHPKRLSTPPVIDGDLDDDAWRGVAVFEPAFTTVSPRYGDQLTENTGILMGYDDDNLYFAFRCSDSKPDKIKASIAARDRIDKDDAVAVSLDTQFSRQISTQFVVNPYGIQRDMINYTDDSVDYVWYSAGKFVPGGYQVEMAIPLSSLRFQGGSDVRMGVLFARSITRDSITAAWPEIKPEQNLVMVHAAMVFDNLPNPASFDVLPVFTYGSGKSRISPGTWGNGFQSREFGGDVKFRRTSALTLEATVNPDFNQVESDAFQMDMNQRYPIFYSEKRPFFMEGMDIFGLSYGGVNFSTTMNTRTILSPSASVKLTGSQGKMAYGAFLADDTGENPFHPFDRGIGDSRYAVARLKYLTGGENYVGLLYSGHTRTEIGNQTAAADAYQRFGHHTLRLTGFGSRSNTEADGKDFDGGAGIVAYDYISLPIGINASFESFSKYFRMDTAFYNRTGFNCAHLGVTPHYYPRFSGLGALTQIAPFINTSFLHDQTAGVDDRYISTGVNTNFVRNGYLNLNLSSNREHWAARVFNTRSIGLSGGLQFNSRIRISSWYTTGRSIYYNVDNPWLGRSVSYGSDLILQPVDRFSETISVSHSELFRSGDNYKAYSVNIVNTRTTFQFNRYFFVRAIFQYNSGYERLLTDLLASFTLIPGTVMHVGYGGISQRNEWDGEVWRQNEHAPFIPLEKRFFLKISYLYRY